VSSALAHSDRPLPILSRPDEITNVQRAALRANRTEATIRRWCQEFGIGRQSGAGATFEVNKIALEMVLHGDWRALELFRMGERTAPEVRRYLDFLGLAA
jgi:hypothetical protein